MGTDNLFHKKKTLRSKWKRQSKFGRSKKLSKMLVVCDDSKSAIYYFGALRNDLRLNNHIEIEKKCSGFDQKSLVECAWLKFSEQKEFLNKHYGEKDAPPYDRVYCIFDQDAPHATDSHQQKYQEALTEIKRINANLALPNDIFKAITSVPCYEFWLLLHCQYTTKPFANSQRRSICYNVISELSHKNCMPLYDKRDKDIYHKTKDKLDTALENADRVEKHNQQVGHDNPSTLIHHLIREWQDICQ